MDPVFQEQWMNINTSVGPEWAEEMRYTGYSRNTVSIQKLQRKAKKGLKKSMGKDQKGTHRRLAKSACGSNVPITSTAIDLVKI